MVDQRFYASAGPLELGVVIPPGLRGRLNKNDESKIVIQNAAETHAGAPGDIVFVASEKYVNELKNCLASAVIIRSDLAEHVPPSCVAIVSDQPHEDFLFALNVLFVDNADLGLELVGGCTSSIEDGVVIAKSATIGNGVEIGCGTRIGPNSVVGDGVRIGRNCEIGANTVIEYALLGDRVVVQAGAVIGSSGFGWLDHGKRNLKIPQLGRAILQSDVMIGPNAVIDRGALGDTVLGENTKLGNGVVIGHNCHLGRNCLLAPTTGLSGATILGDGVIMGAGVGSSGHLEIGSGTMVYARAAVTKNWPPGSQLAGAPAQDIKDFWQELAIIRKLRRGGKK